MVRSLEPEAKCCQPEVHTQKKRTLHYHRRPIPDHLSPLSPTNLEHSPRFPCFSLIALSRKHVHSSNFLKPPPDLIAGEGEYEIDRILHHHGTTRNCSFLIRWKGYSAEEDSWIPEENLSHATETLQEYKTLHPSAFPPRIRVIPTHHTGLPQPTTFLPQVLPAYPSPYRYHQRLSRTYQLSAPLQYGSRKPCPLILQDRLLPLP